MKGCKIAALLVALCLSHGAWAQERHFDLSVMDAVHGIPEFARQAGIQIVAPADDLGGVSTPAIRGNFDVRVALKKLLVGTNLEIASDDGAVVTLRRRAKATKQTANPNGSDMQRPADETGTGAQVVRDYSGPTPTSGLEEIIVTAQKREERLVDVPINITAVSGAEIADRGITNISEMQYAIPGLTITQQGVGNVSIQLNGIAQANGGALGTPVVSQYLDEMPLNKFGGSAQQLQIQLVDMDRVEVLHGPQPTLYGDGAMGGTIHYVTAAPDLSRFGGYVDAGWGTGVGASDSYRGTMVLNAPIIAGELGIRLAASYERDGGWIDSTLTGARNVNDHEITTVRMKTLFTPSEILSVSLLLQHEEGRQPYQDFGALDRTTALNPSPQSQKLDLGNLVASYNFGPATLVSSTGYFLDVWSSTSDFTSVFAGAYPSVAFVLNTNDHEFSQELRLSSNGEGRFHYLAGAYYRFYASDFPDYYANTPPVEPPLYSAFNRAVDRTWAAFGEIRYDITDRLEAQLGLRNYHDSQSGSASSSGLFGSGPQIIPTGTFVSNNPRATLSYKASDTGLLYATVAKGFRSGGTNAGDLIHPTFDPETLWTYTVGAKQEWLDHRFYADISAYYNDYRNIQIVGIDKAGIINGYTGNAGKASGRGMDLALRAKPTSELALAATVGYTDSHFDSMSADANPGDPLNLVAKWTYSVSADYRHPLPGQINLISRVDYQHTSGYAIIDRELPPGVFPTPSRAVLNARLGVELSKWQISLVGKNLTDNNSPIYPIFGVNIEPTLPPPRTIGLEARVSF